MVRRRKPRRVRRIRHHLGLSATALGMAAAIDRVNSSTDAVERASFASAYVALIFLCTTLALGPLKILRERPNPTSSDLRRDVGIWTGGLGLLHTLVGLNVHFRGRPWVYFLYPEGEGGGPRADPFGLANFSGLAAALILTTLLAFSNDLSLRRLGAHRWKNLQRLNYFGFALVLLHAGMYQILESRTPIWSVLLGGAIVLTVSVQAAGFARVTMKTSN